MRAMMVWGLSLCLATAWVQGISLFWRVGLGSCRPLPASRAEAWNVHGVAHVVTGPCPGGAAALPWVTCCVYCYLPGFGLWGIVDAQYVLNTSSTSLIISHACQRWTWLFGACWTALHVVGVSLFCEAGSAVSGLVKVRSHCVRVRIRFSIRFSFRVRRTVYTESEFLSVFDLISCPQLPRQTSKCDFV